MSKREISSSRKVIFYSCGQISDVTAYQSFILLIFTFYFAVVGISTWLMVLGYSLWSVWNALNDPLMGFISDRTHTKIGRRLPYIIGAFIPLAIVTIFLYYPPISFGDTNQLANFAYFFIIIIIFELFYTIYSLNMTSLFPEVFMTQQERTQANNIRQVFTIVGLIFAFILPGVIIPGDWTDPANLPRYQLFGVIAAIIIVAFVLPFLFFGPREKAEFQHDYQKAFGFFGNIKNCFKSKSFRWYIIAETCVWFVYGMLPTIVPLYAANVLGVTGLSTSLLLATTFLSATLFITFLWRPVVRRIGNRKAWIISFIIWIGALSGTLFIFEFIGGLIVFFLIGIGLSGSLFIIDLVVADIVDEDELSTGMRREAGYYGVNALILRLSNVLVIFAIGIVFSGTEWAGGYHPNPGINVIIGLKILMFVFPAIALVIAALAIFKYPLHGQKLKEIKERLNELHEEKKARV